MNRRYLCFESFERIKSELLKSVEIIDYRWYYEHDEFRENAKILLKGII